MTMPIYNKRTARIRAVSLLGSPTKYETAATPAEHAESSR